MSNGKNEHFENFVLFVIVGGLVLAGVIYGIYLFFPFVVFYLIPFVLASVSCGWILRMAGSPSDSIGNLSRYRSVVIAYSAMLLVVGLVFFKDVGRAVVVDQKGKLTNQVMLDWPKLNQYYNAWRRSLYLNAPFEGLRAKANIGVVYDRLEMGWIALVALFFGAPLFYWWLSRNDEELVREVVENLAASRVADKNKRLAEKEKNLNQIIESNKAALNARVRDLEKARELLLAENQALKAKLEFAPDVPRPSEVVSPEKKGVLDQDLF